MGKRTGAPLAGWVWATPRINQRRRRPRWIVCAYQVIACHAEPARALPNLSEHQPLPWTGAVRHTPGCAYLNGQNWAPQRATARSPSYDHEKSSVLSMDGRHKPMSVGCGLTLPEVGFRLELITSRRGATGLPPNRAWNPVLIGRLPTASGYRPSNKRKPPRVLPTLRGRGHLNVYLKSSPNQKVTF